jgi:chemotaxis response regulator CheB
MVVVQTLANGYICHIRRSAPVNGFRLSVEVLFDSVRKASGMVIGILLTGMGIDGF